MIKATPSFGHAVPIASSLSSQKASVSTATIADILSDSVIPVSAAKSIGQATSSIAATSLKATNIGLNPIENLPVVALIASNSSKTAKNALQTSAYFPPVTTIETTDRVASSITSRSEVTSDSSENPPVVYTSQSPRPTISHTQPTSLESMSTNVFTGSVKLSAVSAVTSDCSVPTPIISDPGSTKVSLVPRFNRVPSTEENEIGLLSCHTKLNNDKNLLKESGVSHFKGNSTSFNLNFIFT